MSCPLFHNKVKKLWVYKPLLDHPSLSGRVFILPINRNYFIYSPFTAKITNIHNINPFSSFTNITFDNGVVFGMNNDFELKVGDTVNEGEIIGSTGGISNAGLDESIFANSESSGIVPDIFNISGDADISSIIGGEVQSVPNDTFKTVEAECTGVGSVMVFASLYLPGTVVQKGNVGEIADPGELPEYAGRHFDGWYYGREFKEKYNGTIKYDGINYLWAKWSYDKAGKITIRGKQNIAPGNIIKEVTYDYNMDQYSNFSFPWMLDEDEENIFGELGVVSVIGSQLIDTTSTMGRGSIYNCNLFYSFSRTTINRGEIEISPFIMLNEDAGGRNCGIFFSPIGSQVVYNSGGKFEQTLYSDDAVWLAYSSGIASQSNSVAPAYFYNEGDLEPDYTASIYVATYSHGGTPIQKQSYSPDIIPILTMFSSRITGRPSINMHNRFIFG